MSVLSRHNVHVAGAGPATLVFIHGYGCDQRMWRFLAPAFENRFRVVTYDLAGCGRSEPGTYDRERHGTLHGHAHDLLGIIDACAGGPVIVVGHSVGAMIGMLATIEAPGRFVAQVMVGPSASFVNDGDYVGGFNRAELDDLLASMEANFLGWAMQVAPMIMGAPDRPELATELKDSFIRTDREVARHFARVTFLADHRADLPLSTVPALILQCSDDLLVPREASEYLHRHLAHSTLRVIDNTGHCPHLSAATESAERIAGFVARVLR
jgi:sigma-B regulation protein RsbQ